MQELEAPDPEWCGECPTCILSISNGFLAKKIWTPKAVLAVWHVRFEIVMTKTNNRQDMTPIQEPDEHLFEESD